MARRDWYCEDVLSGKMSIRRLWDDERVLAFHHPEPTAVVHIVIVPKRHVESILAPEALDGELLSSMMRAVQESARAAGLDRTGFQIQANAADPGVTPHMHWHVKGPGIPQS